MSGICATFVEANADSAAKVGNMPGGSIRKAIKTGTDEFSRELVRTWRESPSRSACFVDLGDTHRTSAARRQAVPPRRHEQNEKPPWTQSIRPSSEFPGRHPRRFSPTPALRGAAKFPARAPGSF